MIKEVLSYIFKNNEFDSRKIAIELSFNEELVEQTKINLINKGYLKFEELCDTKMCEKCSCDCNAKRLNDARTIVFTQKAMKILNK